MPAPVYGIGQSQERTVISFAPMSQSNRISHLAVPRPGTPFGYLKLYIFQEPSRRVEASWSNENRRAMRRRLSNRRRLDDQAAWWRL